MPKLENRKTRKRIKSAVEKYRASIVVLQKKMVSVMKKYKEAVDSERMDFAKKRAKK